MYTETISGEKTGPSEFLKEDRARQLPATLPPANERRGRNLILCFDGTGDQFDEDNSNIVEFFGMLKKDDPQQQLVYYQAGIGTYTSPLFATPMAAKISKTLDEAIAWNLSSHIKDGYEFLMQNYRYGDKICIFGFSRGAYTARWFVLRNDFVGLAEGCPPSLVGMIFKVGLLPMCNHQQVPFAYHMYTQADQEGWKMSNAFRKTFSIEVDIEFVGLWDTVDSVGLFPRRLPFATSKTIIRTFRHALALDEHRAKFKANVWNRPTEEALEMACTGLDPNDRMDKRSLDRIYAVGERKPSNIKEVWFAGCHCDVGGGSVLNGTTPNLARIPLRWMIRECFRRNTGIIFHVERLLDTGIDLSTLIPESEDKVDLAKYRPERKVGNSATIWLNEEEVPSDLPPLMSEEEAEFYDALAPIYDQLKLKFFWKILEYIPFTQRVERGEKDEYHRVWNRSRGRHIKRAFRDGVKHKVLVHRSVLIRMEALHKDGTPYMPLADLQRKIDNNHVVWVD